jgi:hypothetical protein
MTTNTLTHEDRQDQVTRDGHDTARRPTAQGHRRLGALLNHLSVLAALAEPEAAVALANGVPNVDDETLVRFLYDSRFAA